MLSRRSTILVALSPANCLLHPITPFLPCILGRSSKVEITVNHLSVSRRHAELIASAEGLHVRDLGSCNGTFLNGARIESGCVIDGQQISFGQAEFLVYQFRKEIDDGDLSSRTPLQTPPLNSDRANGVANERVTAAQAKVLRCILRGLSERETAWDLGVSTQTVHSHVKAIFRHYDVHSKAELFARLITGPSSTATKKADRSALRRGT